MNKKSNFISFLLIVPSIVLVAVFVYGFIFYTFYISLTDWEGLSLHPSISFVGLRNYIKLFTELSFQRFRQDFFNTIYYSFFLIGFTLIIGFLLAVLLDRKMKGENIWRNIFLYPLALSFIVTGTVWRWIFAPEGGLNVLPTLLGGKALSFSWLSSRVSTFHVDWFAFPRLLLLAVFIMFFLWGANALFHKRYKKMGILGAISILSLLLGCLYSPHSRVFTHFLETSAAEWKGFEYATIGVIIAAVWQYSGYAMALYTAGLKGIDVSIRDAASIDGLNSIQFYSRIALPILRPISLSVVVVIAHISLKLFALIMAMAGPDNGGTSHLSISMFLQTFRANQFAEGAAIASILFMLAMIFIIPYLIYLYSQKRNTA